jgi:predicted esterase
MNSKNLTLVFLALLLLPACAHAAEKISKEKFDSPQGKRTYYLFLPDSLKPDAPAPLLVLFHGSGRNGLSLAEKWKEIASREGLILVAPDANNSRGWFIPKDGPEFIHDLVESLKSKYPINPRRVYLFGHSSGAVFALSLSMLESEYFAATAVHAGAWREEKDFSFIKYAKRKTPLTIFVGDRDEFFSVNAVKATEAALRGQGFSVEVTLMKGHDHWYYDLAPEINRNAWDFLKQHGLSQDPKHTDYNHITVTDETNVAVEEINALRGKADELIRRYYAREEALNRTGLTRDRAALAEIVRAQVALLGESADALREAAVKTEAVSKLKLSGAQPQYFALVAQVDRKRIEALAALRERTELLLSDEPFNTVTVKRNEAAIRAERLNQEADELQQKAERVRAGQE